MELLLVVWGIIYCLIMGILCYLITITIIPDKFKDKLFLVVPFFPKAKYSIILYLLSGILYSLFVYLLDIKETIPKVLIAISCVILSSLFVRFIAKLRKENLEDTLDEEIKHKRGF
jgi:hypothetical protein